MGGCGSDNDGTGATSPAPALSATSLEHAAEIEEVVLQYLDGWAEGDPSSIAAVLDDDSFVFNEPGNTDLDEDEFMSLMEPFIGNPSVDAIDHRYFVGDDEIIEVSQTWGFGGGTSEENPVVEVDLYTVHERRDRLDSLHVRRRVRGPMGRRRRCRGGGGCLRVGVVVWRRFGGGGTLRGRCGSVPAAVRHRFARSRGDRSDRVRPLRGIPTR